MTRDSTACMSRIRQEARWIGRSLNRTWEVAQTVIIFDDGSTDETEACCIAATIGMELFLEMAEFYAQAESPWTLDTDQVAGYAGERRVLHYIRSPFTGAVERVDEHRDKSWLWSFCLDHVEFEYVLCLDGDEILSRAAVRHFDTAIETLEEVDMLEIPVLYLWGSENQIRVDGCYGNLSDGYPRARHPRLFTIKRLTKEELSRTSFKASKHGGKFHGGSIPKEGWGRKPSRALFPYPIVHFGYIDRALRERKHAFYTERDPGNQREGEYAHILENPNKLCPGPPQFTAWIDD